MPDAKSVVPGDTSLGMDSPITRRDFLGSTLLASGAMLLGPATPAELIAAQSFATRNGDEFTGYGGVGEYGASNGNVQGERTLTSMWLTGEWEAP